MIVIPEAMTPIHTETGREKRTLSISAFRRTDSEKKDSEQKSVPFSSSGQRIVDRGGIQAARSAFRDYYIQRGQAKIPPRVAYFAPKVGVTPSTTEIRDLGNHWASCSPKAKLNFHWKTMMAPQTIIDYIIVHELCHLHHRDHTTPFWNELDKVMPEYRDRKQWLRRNGAGLDV